MNLPRQRCGMELLGFGCERSTHNASCPRCQVTLCRRRRPRGWTTPWIPRGFAQYEPRQLCLGVDACQPGAAYALDCDLRLVPLAMIASLQRRMEGGIRRTVFFLCLAALSPRAAGLPTCDGGRGMRVAQMGFIAQATFWSVVDLHLAVMPRICDALGRLIVGQHPDSGTGPGGENGAARGRICR